MDCKTNQTEKASQAFLNVDLICMCSSWIDTMDPNGSSRFLSHCIIHSAVRVPKTNLGGGEGRRKPIFLQTAAFRQ